MEGHRWHDLILGMEKDGVEGRDEVVHPSLVSDAILLASLPLCTRVSKLLLYRKTLTQRESFFNSLSVGVKNTMAIFFKMLIIYQIPQMRKNVTFSLFW